jgi:hypothetical protein
LVWAAGLFLFAEIFLRLFPSIGLILGSNMDFHRYYYEAEATKKRGQIEILILGDSAIQNSINPSELAHEWNLPCKSVYNLSYGGGSPHTFLPFLKDNLTEMNQLRAVVWLFNDYRFTDKGCVYPDHVTMDFRSMRAYYPGAALFRVDAIPLYISRLYRLVKLWRIETVRFLFKNRWISKNETGFYLPSQGGWMMLNTLSQEHVHRELEDLSFYRQASPCLQTIAAFREMLDLLTGRGIPVYLLRHAFWGPAQEYFRENCREIFEISEKVLKKANAHRLVTVDLQGLQGFRPSFDAYYQDFQHLWYYGAMEYTCFLARYMKQTYGFSRARLQ